MPAKPQWFTKIDPIMARLDDTAASGDPVLDRRQIQNLFGLSQTDAQRLMHRIGADRIGSSLGVRAIAIRRYLEALRAGDDYQREIRRQERVTTELAHIRKDLVGRQVRIKLPITETNVMPPGVYLQKDRLVVEFAGIEQLAERLYAFSQYMTREFEDLKAFVEDLPATR